LCVLLCIDDDVSDSALKTRHQVYSHHKCVDIQHMLPLSVEAKFVRDVIDRVSYHNYHISSLWLTTSVMETRPKC